MDFECNICKRTFDTQEALEQHRKSKHEEPKTEGRKINKNYIIVAVILIVIILAIVAALYSVPKPYTVKSLDTDNIFGSENATVTIVEFSDFQCPYCGNFYRTTEQQIKQEYIETGQVKIIYKHFPLAIHNNAQKAAEAAECAKDIGGDEVFWQMHDKLFENNQFLSTDKLKIYSAQLNINSSDFNSCLDTGAMADRVSSDMQEGKSLGVTGTPAFFVNGKSIEGAQPFDVFKKAIDAELAKQN